LDGDDGTTDVSGFFSITGQEFCHECPAGYECPDVDSMQMNYCVTGSYSLDNERTCLICPAGYQCVGSVITACPSDMWSNEGEGLCKWLPAGEEGPAVYIDTDGDTLLDYTNQDTRDPQPCDAGAFSLRGTATCIDCPVGHECPNLDEAPRICEPGWYQPSTKQTSCLQCDYGTWSLYG
jgi:hypothetical protein